MGDMKDFTLKEIRMAFRNFAGREEKFNPAGARNFLILLEEDKAAEMAALGWPIKRMRPRDDEPEGAPFIKVKVRYEPKPPKIYLVTSRGKTLMDEAALASLDYVDIERADVTLNPYEWDINGNEGVTAYVKTLFIKAVEDYLEEEWNQLIEGWQREKQLALTSGSEELDYIDVDFDEVREIGG